MGIFKKKPKAVILKNKSSFEKRKWIGIVLLIFAFVLAFVIVPILNNSKSVTAVVAVAATDIKQGTIITSKQITFEERGVYGSTGFIEDKQAVVGKPALVDFIKDDIITKNKIGAENMSKLQSIINEHKGLTTISVKSNAAGLASHLKSGDVVRVYNVSEGDYGKSVIQNPLLEKLEVYDIENSNTESLEKTRNEAELQGSTEAVASTITFITTSKEQEKALLDAEYNGSLHVVFVER